MKKRGRRVMLWAVAFYAVAQLSVTYTMENWLPVGFRSMLHAKWERLNQVAAGSTDRPLMVMVGSSRMEYALDARQFEDLAGPDGRPFVAYNYGMPSLGPLYANLSLQEMLDAKIRPQLLLVEYLPPLLNAPRGTLVSEEAWTAASWLEFRQLVRMWPYLKRPDRKARDWFEARVAPWYVFRREIQAWANGKVHPDQAVQITVPYDPWGHRADEQLTPEERRTRARSACELYRDSLMTLQIGKGPAKALCDLIALCRREQIRVVIVKMAESTEYRSWYGVEARQDVQRFFGELRDRHGAELIDATEWVADDHFIDGHHVTPEGSREFSTRLHEELKRLLARPEGSARVAASTDVAAE
jgi:hypothetical protein